MADISTVTLSNTFAFLVDRTNEIIARINALGVQSNINITGGTLSGVAVTSSTINDTPIGASSPAAGRFTSLTLGTPLAINQGGTGAVSASAARASLGISNAANITEGVFDGDRIPSLDATKIASGTFSIGDFNVDVSIEKSGLAALSVKGTGDSEAYSYLSLDSDEASDKSWQIAHRKDSNNRLGIYYNWVLAAYFDPTDRGFVVGQSTSGGSKGAGTVNSKGFYVDGVKVSDYASLTLPGIIELATTDEAAALSDTTRAITPGNFSSAFAPIFSTSFASALADKYGTSDGKFPVFASGAINFEDKILQRPTFKDYSEKVQTVTATSSLNIDISAGNIVILNQATNITSMTFSNWPTSGDHGTLTIYRVKDATGTSRTISWPSSVDWPGGTAPTLTQTTSAVDIFVFTTVDGGTRVHGGQFSRNST